MVLKFTLFVALAVSATARKAPNADHVKSLLEARPGYRMSNNIEQDMELDAPGLVAKYGYPIQIHKVQTSDGYILEAHRIPHGKYQNNDPTVKRPVVFLMHGLLSSSADYIVLGPGSALAYLLAEAGYDVWLGNARGNYYSRKHVSMNPDGVLQNFWRFSWDEIGNHDLPAFINHILKTTGQEKLHYIGHSQGGTSFLVLNSLRPQYNAKFLSFQGLAPASFFINNQVSLFNAMAPYESVIESTAFTMGQGEIFGQNDFVGWFQRNFCRNPSDLFATLCEFDLSTGLSEREYYNSTMVPLFLAHAPAGSSVRQVAHFGQIIRFEEFRRYNHNTAIQNLAAYGRRTPPEYNLKRVTVPSYLHYGLSDNEVNYKDLMLLADTLPKVVGVYKAARDSFNHYDFIWGSDVKEQVYDNVIALMKEIDSRQ